MNTVAYELKHCLAGNEVNQYPPYNDMNMKWFKKENSNKELTIEILWEVIFPGILIFEENIGGVLVDEFKVYSRDIVK